MKVEVTEMNKQHSKYEPLDPAAERERHRDERRESRNRIKQARQKRTAQLERGDA